MAMNEERPMRNDTYDQQIEALLADDYETFSELASLSGDFVSSHFTAWNVSARSETSIFANLPGAPNHCASTIEYTTWHSELRERLLAGSTVKLPDLIHGSSSDDYRFSRRELEEFARRQRVARGLIDA